MKSLLVFLALVVVLVAVRPSIRAWRRWHFRRSVAWLRQQDALVDKIFVLRCTAKPTDGKLHFWPEGRSWPVPYLTIGLRPLPNGHFGCGLGEHELAPGAAMVFGATVPDGTVLSISHLEHPDRVIAQLIFDDRQVTLPFDFEPLVERLRRLRRHRREHSLTAVSR